MLNLILMASDSVNWATNYLGNWNWISIVLLLIGIGLLIVEMITPGLGVPGIAGVVCLIAVVILQARHSLADALITMTIIVVILLIAGIITFKSFDKGRISNTDLVLKESINENSTSVADEKTRSLIGRRGVTQSELRPVGYGDFDGKRIDIVAEGEFIPKGVTIEIVAVEDLKIKVRRLED